MKNALVPALALASALALGSSSAAQTAAAAKPAPGGVVESSYLTLKATVVSVDLKTREATLKDEAGKVFTISVDEKVKNLDAVRPGDVVNARYSESLAYSLKQPGQGTPGGGTKVTGDSGKPGEKPKGVSTKVTTKTVTITAIDPKAPSVTFKDAEGKEKTVAVKDPGNLKGVQVGQLVEVTYREAMAFSVEKAPAK